MLMIPNIIEETSKGERSFDIYSRLVKDRIVFLGDEVDQDSAHNVIAQLLYLDSIDHEKPISLYIDSPGGSVTAGLGIYDTMNFIKAPVYTYCLGMAASMGAFLLAAGEKGHRMATPNATIMTHMVSSGTQGNIQDMRVSMAYTEALNKRLSSILAKNCNQDLADYEKTVERDNFMFPDEAMKYGIIDEIINNPSEEEE